MLQFTAPQHRVKGFTLLELLIALAVAGILAALVAPPFSGFLARQQLRSDLNEVVSVLSFARSEAIKRRADVTVDIDSSGDTWNIGVSFGSPSETLRVANGRQQAVTLTGISQVVFNSLGAMESCSTSDCQLELNHSRLGDDKTEVVTISPAGGVRREG
ncbi:GspH/FimT family pseudopilin [Halomonas sp. CH40]